MTGEKLHAYDLELCAYVVGNFSQYLHEKRFRRYLKKHIAPATLWQYLLDYSNPAINQDWLLLNNAELHTLLDAVEGGPLEMDRAWEPAEALHRRYVETVKEVRNELSKQVAEDWSRDCAEFSQQLERELPLAEGIEIVQKWIGRLRQLLRTMEATPFLPCPEGSSPTPTCSTPAPGSSPARGSVTTNEAPEEELESLNKLRALIAKHEHGPRAIPKSLIQHSGMREQRVRIMLRKLEALGEYQGFARKRPKIFRQREQDQS